MTEAKLNRRYMVRNQYAPPLDPNMARACNDCAYWLADVLASDNPRFDRARFLEAAGAFAVVRSGLVAT